MRTDKTIFAWNNTGVNWWWQKFFRYILMAPFYLYGWTTEMMAWIVNQTHGFMWDVITNL